MADNILDTIRLARAQEALRQESEAFEQAKKHADGRYLLQIAIGWVAVIMIPAIAGICSYIIYNNQQFTSATVTASTAALFVDILGLMISVWKVFLSPSSVPKLEPVTRTDTLAAQNQPGQITSQIAPQIAPPIQENTSVGGAEQGA